MSSVIQRRRFLRTAAGAGIGALAFPFALRSAAESAGRPPNIVFIMADDLGLRHLGCYGGEKIHTPNIDRLAVEGVRFSQAYAGCTVCAPSRSSLMTGLHTGHAPVRGNSGGIPLRDEDLTLAEVLKKAGYATGGYGKWGLGEAGTSGAPHLQGFDEFVGYYHQIHAHFYYPEYLWKNGMRWPLPGNQTGGRLPGNAGGLRTQYAPDEILEQALNFIRANQDRPFFCYLSSIIPHVELCVPDQDLVPYLGRFEETPFVDPRPGYQGSAHPRATYAAMVSHLDANVGKVMALLKELDLEENSLVFFTSDNGAQGGFGGSGNEFFDFFKPMEPFRGTKGSMYEGGLRVPMISRWPGKIRPGTLNEDLVWYFPDVLPTLAELAGARPPAGLDGLSLLPTLLNGGLTAEKQQRHAALYWELSDGPGLRQALRMGDWKAVRNDPKGALELFDLGKDLRESTDLAGRNPERLRKFEDYLKVCRSAPRPQVEPVTVKDRNYF